MKKKRRRASEWRETIGGERALRSEDSSTARRNCTPERFTETITYSQGWVHLNHFRDPSAKTPRTSRYVTVSFSISTSKGLDAGADDVLVAGEAVHPNSSACFLGEESLVAASYPTTSVAFCVTPTVTAPGRVRDVSYAKYETSTKHDGLQGELDPLSSPLAYPTYVLKTQLFCLPMLR